MLLGAHTSISGGLHRAIIRGNLLGCTCIQIFIKNANRWYSKRITEEEKKLFLETKAKSRIELVIAHNSYLINLASENKLKLQKSIDSLYREIERAEILEIPYLVMHPGAHLGAGEQNGLDIISEALIQLIEKTKNFNIKICLETTAGQGTVLGYKFEQLNYITESINKNERLGVCFDTCHVFASGYDLRTKEEYDKTLCEFDRIVGLDKIWVIHLNDSMKMLGSKKDRHAHIGQGKIGINAFKYFMNDKKFFNVPKIIETPKGIDLFNDKDNLRILRMLKEGNVS